MRVPCTYASEPLSFSIAHMGWMDRLDRRATNWTLPTRAVYLAAKWSLVALGAFALVRLWLDRIGLWPLFDTVR